MHVPDGRIARIEDYLDAAPRSRATPERVGPFTLFVGTGPWPYYARPARHGPRAVTATEVAALRARQREIDVPEEIEWQETLAPTLARACREAGMSVHRFRLLALPDPLVPTQTPPSDTTRIVDADEDLVPMLAIQQQAFGGSAGVAAVDVDHLRARIRARETVVVVGHRRGRPVCVGMHQPVGDVTELVGVSTLPAERRHGWATAVMSMLVADAVARGVRTVVLSAASDAVAHIYEGVGFRDVSVVCAAEPAGRPGRV